MMFWLGFITGMTVMILIVLVFDVKKLMDWILRIIGLAYIVYTVYRIVFRKS